MVEIKLNRTHSKFSKDNIDYEDSKFTIRTFGVFLGIETTKVDLAQVIIERYTKEGETFVKRLRGSFAIYILDKDNDRHYLYTNQIGDKRLFYYNHNDEIILSNSVKTITESLVKKNIKYHLDQQSAYQLLSFGFLLEDYTLVNEIKRIKPGHYIKIENDCCSIHKYYSIQNTPKTGLPENEQIKMIDELFTNAIRLEYNKDLEYNYSHLSSLSGGLDCRMNTFAAHAQNYQDVTNLTFSQTGYLDQTLAQEMATDLGNTWLFCSLDHACFMFDINKLVELNEGSCVVMGQMHGDHAFSKVNHELYGLLHTGQVGDAIIGSIVNNSKYNKPSFGKGISTRFLDKITPDTYNTYENQELFLLNNRGFNGALTGNLVMQKHTEVASPFLDVDFLDYVLSIPLEQRIHHKIYKKWIISKYPKAANYIWESDKTKINAKIIVFREKSIPLKKFPQWFYKEIRKRITGSGELDNKNGMNPFAYWYKENPKVISYYQSLFDTHINLISDDSLKTDCQNTFSDGTISEKIAVLTLLTAIHYLGL